ncbi:hypothetical protein [Trujillonella endophytica]|uniref:Uncharacterized protein n=1 Tax=Trujillonella endophytica TaxID=673521 RepID=A0A1H8PK45_9ACTN|nr:hypothetical protein [Trujillella endophytica]SEO42322.1 hypothetical protein SAMN05660991_00232 [Trujillella endophytica]
MAAVLTRTHTSDDDLRPLEIVAPAAPSSPIVPPEPVDQRPRYWDFRVAAWRPSPIEDGC